METIHFIIKMLLEPALTDFLKENVPGDVSNLFVVVNTLTCINMFMEGPQFRLLAGEKKRALIEDVRVTAHKVGFFMSEIVNLALKVGTRNGIESHHSIESATLPIPLLAQTEQTMAMASSQPNQPLLGSSQCAAYHRTLSAPHSHLCSIPSLPPPQKCSQIVRINSLRTETRLNRSYSTNSTDFLGKSRHLCNSNLTRLDPSQFRSDLAESTRNQPVFRTMIARTSSSGAHVLVKHWKETLDLINGSIVAFYNLMQTEIGDWEIKELGPDNFLNEANRIKNMLLETEDISNWGTLTEVQSLAFFLTISRVDHLMKQCNDLYTILFRITIEVGNLPRQISKACEGQPLALLLIGSLLPFKVFNFAIWNKVKDDLVMIKKTSVTSNHMWNIIAYCYDNLPVYYQYCFLYFACYPIDSEIPATSLTKIWIAEGFIATEDGENIEEAANKLLENFVKRSLIYVTKRSFLGTIKSCRLLHPIHEFAIRKSKMEGFLAANPDNEEIESVFRLAMHDDNNKQYTEEKMNHLCSILTFNCGREVLGSALLLKVLELRKSVIPVTTLPTLIYLRYLNLRGSIIFELPKNMEDMKNLEMLDVRDTSIKTLPESLWNISTLRYIYVEPSPQIKGPPSTAKLLNLQTLKTVGVHSSWQENIPHYLIHLRKLAISNWDNLDLRSISNLLSHIDKLISLAIMSNIIPSESVDIRAFPNLKTMMSIKLVGKWNCRNLFIDNVKFPTNLTKLTLTNSGLKEDPMPTLGRLRALKFLSLKDGAYTGKRMVCSTNEFPQLQFLELSKLENLEIWVVKLEDLPKGFPQLSTLRVVQCRKLKNFPNLDHVTDKVID